PHRPRASPPAMSVCAHTSDASGWGGRIRTFNLSRERGPRSTGSWSRVTCGSGGLSSPRPEAAPPPLRARLVRRDLFADTLVAPESLFEPFGEHSRRHLGVQD